MGGEKDWLAADFEADVADGFSGGEKDWLAADFEADVADGFSVGEKDWLAAVFSTTNEPIFTGDKRGGGQSIRTAILMVFQ